MKISTTDKKFFWLLTVLILIPNLLTSALVELSFDEAYYWLYSENLAWGYFDHPPLVALMIKLGTLIFGKTEIGVRLVANLLMYVAAILLWMMTESKNLFGFFLLFFTMPLIQFSGIFSLPDSVLLITSVFYFWFLKKFVENDSWKNAIFLAFSIAVMFYAKYHGLLIVLLTICGNPKFILRRKFWAVAAMTTLFYLPHIFWQINHEFISFKFHLFGRKEKHFSFSNITDYVASQIAAMGLFNFFLICYAMKKQAVKNTFERILIWNSFGFLLFLFLLSFRNQIEANWTVTCSIVFIILMVDRLKRYKPALLFCSLPSLILILGMRGAILSAESLSHYRMDDENRFNEISKWKNERIPEIIEQCGDLPIVAENYQYAAKVSFYTDQTVPGLHLKSRTSQFGLWNFEKTLKPSESVCLLTTKKIKGAYKIETYFKDPIYVVRPTSLRSLAKMYNTTYQEIISR